MKQSLMPSQFDLNAMAIFVKVVQTGSFIGAARVLDIPKTTISRRITQLEATLGTRLLQRTTRKVNLTEVGRVYFERCARILGELEEANLTVTALCLQCLTERCEFQLRWCLPRACYITG